MEGSHIFEILMTKLCDFMEAPSQKQNNCKRQRTLSVCQTPARSKKKIATVKSLKNFKHLNLMQRMSEMEKNNSCFDDQQSKYFVSEKKQRINQPCVLCGIKPCNYRLACAHAIHEECFNKSPFLPLCKICESKNISTFQNCEELSK